MPSSHALVSFFLSSAWFTTLAPQFPESSVLPVSLYTSASLVSLLRVICGYHTWAQIGVGAVVGLVLGILWGTASVTAHTAAPRMTTALAWLAYLMGSAVFILKKMRSWVGKDKNL